jgi:lipopolysaccharide assembly outer membrane protein LptD (OstA)
MRARNVSFTAAAGRAAVLLLGWWLCAGGPGCRAVAQDAPADTAAVEGGIDAWGEQLNYDRAAGVITATGRAVVRRGNVELRADYVRVNVITEEAYAAGNVVLRRGEEVWRGRQLEYNFKTQQGVAEGVSGVAEPFRLLETPRAERIGANTFRVLDGKVTTCTNAYPHCHFHVRAREVTIVPGEYVKGRGARWYFGSVPVMYLPYWKRRFNADDGWRFRPGYSSRWGAFLLSSYGYPLSSNLSARTHVDYRTKRGAAVGQDVKWKDRGGRWYGDVSLYYADDREPLEDYEDPLTSDIDPERYRILLRHQAALSPRDSFIGQAQWLSDRDMREDFFEREYRQNRQPENFLSYMHRQDRWTAGVLLRARLNDFYTEVNRLPEVSLDLLRQPLGSSGVYYESQSAAAFLEKVFADDAAGDYGSVRLDSEHRVFYPVKCFGFLNLVPRAGVRGTYYSETPRVERSVTVREYAVTNLVAGETGDPVPVVTFRRETNTLENVVDDGAAFRDQFELGLETSFKAFKTWQTAAGDPRRHIVEPYANYYFYSEPSELPSDLYSFDETDALTELHGVRFGVRNKLQCKRGGRPFDLLDVDVYTRYRFEYPEDQEAMDRVFMDAELRPFDWLSIDVDGILDLEASTLEQFNTQVRLRPGERWRTSLEHRYADARSNLFNYDVTYLPNRDWAFNLFGRYEFEESRMEEQGGYVQRNLDCLSLRTGMSMLPGYTRSDGADVEDEWRFMVQFWLTAFPDKNVGTGGWR